MTSATDPILHQFDALNVWSRGGERAPHKPLLVLYALGHFSIVILNQWLPR
jgi:putative restriction endonuclease